MSASPSSDDHAIDPRWALHYAQASRRRRERGWYRRQDGRRRGVVPRWRVYSVVSVVAVFAALVVTALMSSK